MKFLSNLLVKAGLVVEGVTDLYASAAVVDTDKFVVLDGNTIKYRTGAQVLSDIGAEASIPAGTTAQYWRGDKSWQTLDTTAVAEGTNLYFTDARARAAISLTTTGTSGAATYVGGVLNIPQYQAVLTNPVTGTGSAGQVTYWGSSSTITGSNNLFWDATNNRLGIGVSSPLAPLQIGNGYTDAGYTGFRNTNSPAFLIASASTDTFHRILGGTYNTASTINVDLALPLTKNLATAGTGFRITSGVGTGITTVNGYLAFSSLTGELAGTFTATERMRLVASTGNLLLGSTTDNGLRFQVTGDGFFSGAVSIGTTSTAQKLNVSGTGNYLAGFTNSAGTSAALINFTNTSGDFYIGNDSVGGGALSGTPYARAIWGQGAYPMVFATNNLERMRLHSTGNLHLGGTSDNGLRFQVTGDGYFSGSVGVGTSSLTGFSLRVNKVITGAATSYGVRSDGIVQSDVSGQAIGYDSSLGTQAAAFTLPVLTHYRADQSTFGAGSAVTTQYGFQVRSNLIGATNNYGFFGDIASGTGRWNLYMNGTAANYLAGNLGIGSAITTFKLSTFNTGSYTIGLLNSSIGTPGEFVGITYGFGASTYNKGAMYFISRDANGRGDFHFALNNAASAANVSTSDARMILTYEGNLGLGVTPSAWGSGWSALQIKSGGLSLWTDGGIRSFISTNTFYNGTNRIYVANGTAAEYAQDNGTHLWRIASTGTAGGTISFTQAMTLQSTGNLVIGSTSDTGERLQVTGTMRVSGASTLSGIMTLTGAYISLNANGYIRTDNANFLTLQSGSSGFVVKNSGNANDNFVVNNSGAGTFLSSATATTFIAASSQANTSDYNYLIFNNLAGGYGDWNIYKSGANNLALGYGTDGGATYTNAVTFAYGGAATFSSSVTANSFIKTGGLSTEILRADGQVYTFPLNISSPSNGQVLKFNGTSWVNDSDAGITGSGASTQIAYFTGATTLASSNNFFWDNTNNRLNINTAGSTGSFTVNVRSSAAAILSLKGGASTNQGGALYITNANNSSTLAAFGDSATIAGGTPDLGAMIYTAASVPLQFYVNNAERMRLHANGNLVLGGTVSTDNGLRFQVTGDGYFSGGLGVGGTTYAYEGISLRRNLTGLTVAFGVVSSGTIQSDVTSGAYYFTTGAKTQAAAFTLGNLYHYDATQGTFGASSAVTNQYGFFAGSSIIGATNNYGFYGNIASGTGRWNLYMNGSAANYLLGNTLIGEPRLAGAAWTKYLVVGDAGADKLIMGYLASSTNGVTIGANSNTFNVWANLNIAGSQLIFRIAETERMRLDASGNLGLGVTPSAWSVLRGLQVGLTASVAGYAASTEGAFFSSNSFYDGGAFKYQVTGFATQYLQINGEHRWSSAPSGTAATNITLTRGMTLFSTGNLGVGSTTDNGYKLILNGGISLSHTGGIAISYPAGQAIRSNGGIFIDYGNGGSGDLVFRRGAGVTNTLTLAVADGAATFSSSVTTNATGASISMTTAGDTALWSQVTNAGGILYVGRDNAAGGSFGVANGHVIYGTGARPMVFFTNATERFRISDTGAATFSSTLTASSNITSTDGTSSTVIQTISNAPRIVLIDGRVGGKIFDIGPHPVTSSGNFVIRDATATVNRFTIESTGDITFSNNSTALAFIPSGATVPTNGMYLPAANTLGFATNTTEDMRLTSSGNLLIATTTDTGEKLQVNGDAKITGKLLLSGSVATAVNGDYSVNFSKTYAQGSAISNTNLYGLVSSTVFDLTNGAYSGSATYNATALFAQASVAGNAGTQSTQPIRAMMAVLVGKSSSAAMNLADFRYIDVKAPDNAGVSGHVIGDIYGLRIAALKGATNYTITNGWGVYQEGTTDNNYFGGKVLVGTATAGSSPVRISGLPTSSAGLSAGDLWNNGGVINVA